MSASQEENGAREGQSVHHFGDSRDEVYRRALAANAKITLSELTNSEGGVVVSLRLHLPNGRETRLLPVGAQRASVLRESNFEHWTLLSDYVAFYDRAEGVIEASCRSETSLRWLLRRIPGVIQEEGDLGTEGGVSDEAEVGVSLEDIDLEKAWSLPIEGTGAFAVELSPPSSGMFALYHQAGIRREQSPTRFLSLKIKKVSPRGHDEAVELLERLSSALFFEMDLLYGILMRLARDSSSLRRRGSTPSEINQSPLRLPRLQYAKEAIALYEYARSAPGIPLLEFLAYYQAIEYYFPSFAHQEALRRLRHELADPRFDLHDESHLNRIFAIVGQSARGSSSERQQLKDTLSAILDDHRMLAFVKESEERAKFLTESSGLKGVHVINLRDSGRRLVHQVADRVYDLRCRIVHTKEDGGAPGVKMLVPGSRESKLLTYDIELVRFLAQKAIIAGGSRSPW
ncbi:hypothetical protein [Micromonospora chokoriensis]